MTISIWRYSHLVLAVSSFVFIFLASITGIVLAFQPISEQLNSYKVNDFKTITLAETISGLKRTYPEVIDVQIDANDFVLASVITEDGESLNGYINPKTAEFLGDKIETSKFFQWVTSFHRSLFLKSIGRFFVGLCSFLLFLIAISGAVLILKRQRSLKKFFSKIVNENFSQYWHVVLGRLSLIPIIIITVTGVYLSAEKFDLLPAEKHNHQIDYDAISETPKTDILDFDVFKNTPLSEVKTIEFPFSDDVEDYFTIALKNKELVVNQYTGDILSEIDYPLVTFFSGLSLNLHTGKGSIIWSLVLAFACLNILFFIYSGFVMTLKRRQAKLKNKYKKDACKYVILVGSENGSTLPFANALHEQLLAIGQTSFITQLNDYTTYDNAEHLIIFTATYGQGEAPTNANAFLKRLQTVKQTQKISYSVVGFGSLSYPDFCKFAFDIDTQLQKQFHQESPVFTINDKSVESFETWLSLWTVPKDLQLHVEKENLVFQPKLTHTFTVKEKTNTDDNPDDTFLLTLQPKKGKPFTSGDLLAIYPNDDYRERLYSIGKVGKELQLSVKHYQNGLGSNFLYQLPINSTFKARVINNTAFHIPKKVSQVIMIANGTGVAPFLGMLSSNTNPETYLYLGLRTQKAYQLYQSQINTSIAQGNLQHFNLALSQEVNSNYVQDLVLKDAAVIAKVLQNNGVIMICGSLAMHKGVVKVITQICSSHTQKSYAFYKKNQQILSDCY